MIRLVLDRALYSFALADGSFGALYPGSHVRTPDGNVNLPGEDVLFLVGCRFRGVLYMAGQGQSTGRAWLWNGGVWIGVGTTHGVSPCAFGSDSLFIADSGSSYIRYPLNESPPTLEHMQIGSQGLRYVDGDLVFTGDETHRDGDLFQYTERGDVKVGQGWNDGALINGRVLEPGDCQFIRFDRAGDALAVAIVQQPLNRAVLHWLTVQDIASLPLPGTPEPEPLPMTEAQIVASVRGKYPTPLGVTHGACLVEIATTLGNDAGLLRKDTGTFIELSNGVKVSQDIICFPSGQIFDCLGDAEGQATPGWSPASGGPFPERYYRVGSTPPPDPDPEPEPDPQVPENVTARLAALEGRMRRLEAWTRGV